MLILQRKLGESVRIGENITVSIVSIDSNRVRIAIDAPSEIPILRSELLETIAANQESAMDHASAGDLMALLDSVLESSAPERKESGDIK